MIHVTWVIQHPQSHLLWMQLRRCKINTNSTRKKNPRNRNMLVIYSSENLSQPEVKTNLSTRQCRGQCPNWTKRHGNNRTGPVQEPTSLMESVQASKESSDEERENASFKTPQESLLWEVNSKSHKIYLVHYYIYISNYRLLYVAQI